MQYIQKKMKNKKKFIKNTKKMPKPMKHTWKHINLLFWDSNPASKCSNINLTNFIEKKIKNNDAVAFTQFNF